jgi:uncharacterized membrane protein
MLVAESLVEGACRFTLSPNCSLSWRWVKWLVFALACAILAVAAYWASLGAWLVLPFTGLELVVLGAGFYLASVAAHRREVIEIGGEHLRVLHGGRRLAEVAHFPRHWTRATLARDPGGWYPSHLVLHCQGRRLEVATRVIEAEREELAAALQGWLGLQGAGIARREATLLHPGLASPAPQAQREGIWQ